MSDLSATCPCGHTANFHPTIEQKRVYWAGCNGRYDLECKHYNGPGVACCRCAVSREDVIDGADHA